MGCVAFYCLGRGNGSIVQAAEDGNIRAVRHLVRTKPDSLQETDDYLGRDPNWGRIRYVVLGPDCPWGLEAKRMKITKAVDICNRICYIL